MSLGWLVISGEGYFILNILKDRMKGLTLLVLYFFGKFVSSFYLNIYNEFLQKAFRDRSLPFKLVDIRVRWEKINKIKILNDSFSRNSFLRPTFDFVW